MLIIFNVTYTFMTKSAKNILSILTLLSCLLLFTQCKDMAVQKFIELFVSIENKNCPRMIDNITRLDSCIALPNKTVKYSATILHLDASKINTKESSELVKKNLVYALQTNPQLKEGLKLGISFLYLYHDQKGSLIYEISITPDDYNKPIVKPDEVDLSSDEKVIAYMQTMVEEVKPNLPSEVGPGVIMTNCIVAPNKVLEYTYTLANSNEVKADTTAFKEANKPNQVEVLKSLPVVTSLLKKGATLKYVYQDKNNKYICATIISSEDL